MWVCGILKFVKLGGSSECKYISLIQWPEWEPGGVFCWRGLGDPVAFALSDSWSHNSRIILLQSILSLRIFLGRTLITSCHFLKQYHQPTAPITINEEMFESSLLNQKQGKKVQPHRFCWILCQRSLPVQVEARERNKRWVGKEDSKLFFPLKDVIIYLENWRRICRLIKTVLQVCW